MKLVELEKLVNKHSGEFFCTQIHNESATKLVPFKHIYDPPRALNEVLDIEKLNEFYETFGNLLMYFDEKSGDAALYIASPDQWVSLHSYFGDWLEGLEEDERDELLPEWIDNCLVIGEIPHSGNYILMPKSGEKTGYVYEFEHDGFEFIELAKDIEEYIKTMLNLNSSGLTNIASHMRFIVDSPEVQWWIKELRDNTGNVVNTEA